MAVIDINGTELQVGDTVNRYEWYDGDWEIVEQDTVEALIDDRNVATLESHGNAAGDNLEKVE